MTDAEGGRLGFFLGFAVAVKLRLPRVLRSELLFKLRLIAVSLYAPFSTTALFHYGDPYKSQTPGIRDSA